MLASGRNRPVLRSGGAHYAPARLHSSSCQPDPQHRGVQPHLCPRHYFHRPKVRGCRPGADPGQAAGIRWTVVQNLDPLQMQTYQLEVERKVIDDNDVLIPRSRRPRIWGRSVLDIFRGNAPLGGCRSRSPPMAPPPIETVPWPPPPRAAAPQRQQRQPLRLWRASLVVRAQHAGQHSHGRDNHQHHRCIDNYHDLNDCCCRPGCTK